MKEFDNWEDIFQNNNDDVITLLNDDVNYIKLVAKEKTKTKNLKVKKKYFILQEKDRRFLKLIKNNEIETSSMRHRKIIKIDKNFLAKVSKLKQ